MPNTAAHIQSYKISYSHYVVNYVRLRFHYELSAFTVGIWSFGERGKTKQTNEYIKMN